MLRTQHGGFGVFRHPSPSTQWPQRTPRSLVKNLSRAFAGLRGAPRAMERAKILLVLHVAYGRVAVPAKNAYVPDRCRA